MAAKMRKKKMVKDKEVPFRVTTMKEGEIEVLDDETIKRIRKAENDIAEGKGTFIDMSKPGELKKFLDKLGK
jgi:hypothetical protein